MRSQILLIALLLMCKISFAQQHNHPAFPQTEINNLVKPSNANGVQKNIPSNIQPASILSSPKSIFNLYDKAEQLKNQFSNRSFESNKMLLLDTVYVGDVPNDTLIITGAWTHTGPIFVFNDGVLIFYNATVINEGDVFVFGNGKLFADSSSLTFPQQFFYERSLLAVQNSFVHIQNSAFNYSGMSHNLFIADSAVVEMVNIHQDDFTTCGLFGKPTLTVNGSNLGGEYILTDGATASFKNVDTLLLWHHFPTMSMVNFSFPNGDTVYNYAFNNSIFGVSGINYNVTADSCHTVWWGMMPVNGSDITISNSVIRAIGAWFQYGDSASVTGLYDNSSYTNFVMPVADRNLHLINSSVQTWSLYAFDSSHINIDNSQLGEVGCQQRASVLSSQFLLDGSGGYFWATDTSVIFANDVTVYTTVRSERNGIFILAYGWLPFMPPQAIGNGLTICVQSNLAFDPVAYNNGVAWLQNISQPDTSFTDSIIQITGSAWIDQGPDGGWMDFANYSFYYQLQGSTSWTPLVLDSINEIHNGTLANWNTYGLQPGNYLLRLLVKNTFNDSIEAIKPITLLPSTVGLIEHSTNAFYSTVYPNPSDGNFHLDILSDKNEVVKIEIEDALSKVIYKNKVQLFENHQTQLLVKNEFSPEFIFYKIQSTENILTGKIVVR